MFVLLISWVGGGGREVKKMFVSCFKEHSQAEDIHSHDRDNTVLPAFVTM